MCIRDSGISFPKAVDLDAYMNMLEEAKKREMCIRDSLKLFKALNVIFKVFTACAGPCSSCLLYTSFPADGNYSTDVALHAVPGRRKMGGDISIKGTRYGEEAFLILKGQGNRINGVLESTVFWPDSQGRCV